MAIQYVVGYNLGITMIFISVCVIRDFLQNLKFNVKGEIKKK